MPLIPALGRQRQTDWISEFKASLVYIVSSRTAWATQRKPVLKNKQTKNQTKKQKNKGGGGGGGGGGGRGGEGEGEDKCYIFSLICGCGSWL